MGENKDKGWYLLRNCPCLFYFQKKTPHFFFGLITSKRLRRQRPEELSLKPQSVIERDEERLIVHPPDEPLRRFEQVCKVRSRTQRPDRSAHGHPAQVPVRPDVHADRGRLARVAGETAKVYKKLTPGRRAELGLRRHRHALARGGGALRLGRHDFANAARPHLVGVGRRGALRLFLLRRGSSPPSSIVVVVVSGGSHVQRVEARAEDGRRCERERRHG